MYDVVLRSAVASFRKSISVELSGRCDCVWVWGLIQVASVTVAPRGGYFHEDR